MSPNWIRKLLECGWISNLPEVPEVWLCIELLQFQGLLSAEYPVRSNEIGPSHIKHNLETGANIESNFELFRLTIF